MDCLRPYSFSADENILAAWDSQVALAADIPSLRESLAQRSPELFSRFAESYARLRALRETALTTKRACGGTLGRPTSRPHQEPAAQAVRNKGNDTGESAARHRGRLGRNTYKTAADALGRAAFS